MLNVMLFCGAKGHTEQATPPRWLQTLGSSEGKLSPGGAGGLVWGSPDLSALLWGPSWCFVLEGIADFWSPLGIWIKFLSPVPWACVQGRGS